MTSKLVSGCSESCLKSSFRRSGKKESAKVREKSVNLLPSCSKIQLTRKWLLEIELDSKLELKES